MAAGVIGIVLAPHPPVLGEQTTGDRGVGEIVRRDIGDGRGYAGLSVALVDHGTVRAAGLGDSGNPDHPQVDTDTVFEIGSVGKAMAGMLLADLDHNGTVRLDTPISKLLPDTHFADPAIGSVTLEELATHHSGLPRIPDDADIFLRSEAFKLLGVDPYQGVSAQDVILAAAATRAEGQGRFAYSNLGMALAGQAAARATGMPYDQLLRQRILNLLGMRNSRFVTPETPPNTASGQQENGAPVQHWRASGYMPAGDLWSTSTDLARLVSATMAGTAPGADAARPRVDATGFGKIGLGWLVSTIEGHEITWHDGETGGFRSYVGFDRAAQRGVVVLSNTDRSVDDLGQRLLGITSPVGADDHDHLVATTLFTVVLTLLAGTVVLWPAARAHSRRLDRVRHVANVAFGLGLLALYWRVGAWFQVPPAVWTLGCVLLGIGACTGLQRWQQLPMDKAKRPRALWQAIGVAAGIRLGALIMIALGS